MMDSLSCVRTEGWGPMPYLPTFFFFVNYFFFLNRAIKMAVPRRHRVATAFRWCMAFTLASQAYEIWTKIVSVVTCIAYDFIGVYPTALSSAVLTAAAMTPLATALAMSRSRQLPLSWTSHPPRCELGPMNYYLHRPPPPLEEYKASAPSRSRSQEDRLFHPVRRPSGQLKVPRTA